MQGSALSSRLSPVGVDPERSAEAAFARFATHDARPHPPFRHAPREFYLVRVRSGGSARGEEQGAVIPDTAPASLLCFSWWEAAIVCPSPLHPPRAPHAAGTCYIFKDFE